MTRKEAILEAGDSQTLLPARYHYGIEVTGTARGWGQTKSNVNQFQYLKKGSANEDTLYPKLTLLLEQLSNGLCPTLHISYMRAP